MISRRLELEPYEPDDDFLWLKACTGSTAIARVHTNPTWLVSVHLSHRPLMPALIDTLGVEGIALVTRDDSRWETDVIPHELHRLFADEPFL